MLRRWRRRGGNGSPGDQLPIQGKIAAIFGVSLRTVAHALGELRDRGLVNTIPGVGTFALEPKPPSAEDGDSFIETRLAAMEGGRLDALERKVAAAERRATQLRSDLGLPPWKGCTNPACVTHRSGRVTITA